MNIKYWEFEDAPIKEKIKNPKIKDIAMVLFENELEAYRFSKLMEEVKRSKKLRLNEIKFLPKSTAKRYLDYAVQIGLLKHEDMTYELTDRFSKPLKNFWGFMTILKKLPLILLCRLTLIFHSVSHRVDI